MMIVVPNTDVTPQKVAPLIVSGLHDYPTTMTTTQSSLGVISAALIDTVGLAAPFIG